MDAIESFKVDHRKIKPGIYTSRVDDNIITYDLRFKKPNTGDLLANATMHSIEHMFATLIRNSSIKEKIVYFGPMGCQTGFYLITHETTHSVALLLIKQTLLDIITYTGKMVGNSEVECGNYKNLDLQLAKDECYKYYSLVKDWKVSDLKY